MLKKKFVSNRSIGGIRDAAGIGYLIIPSDQDKKGYIEKCYRTGTISLSLENGGIIDNVLITKNALNELDFPDKFNELGTILVWINQPRKNQPIVIGSISKTNEFVNFNKSKSSLRRATNGFVEEVIVDADKGVIVINSNSSKELGGDIYVVSTNSKKTSKLIVRVSGNIDIASTNFFLENSKKLLFTIKDKDQDDKITTISYEKGVGFKYKDEFDNEINADSDNVQVKPNSKFNVGDGKEPMMLSDTFKDIFENFTDIISDMAQSIAQLQVGTVFGPSTIPTNTADFVQYKAKLVALKKKYKKFQSKVSNTD